MCMAHAVVGFIRPCATHTTNKPHSSSSSSCSPLPRKLAVTLLALVAAAVAVPIRINGRVGDFSWSNCGRSNGNALLLLVVDDGAEGQTPLQITSFSIGPDPIATPGNVTVSGGISLSSELSSPIKVTLDIGESISTHGPCSDDAFQRSRLACGSRSPALMFVDS